jgi:transglutaminase-like putative cysteine protease
MTNDLAHPTQAGVDLGVYLASTSFLDADHVSVRRLAAEAKGGPVERAVHLYYAVRDGLRYDPYSLTLEPDAYRASSVIRRGGGYCVAKAVTFAAAARAAGIPARLGFADVRNHLATKRLLALMGTDVFRYHGYAELWLEGRWVKATPTFNLALCQRFRVRPLDFDGRADAIFHPFDADNRRHMEYLADHGAYADLPFDELAREMKAAYPKMFGGAVPVGGDFAAEAEREAAPPTFEKTS